MMTLVDQGQIMTFADRPKGRPSPDVASMVHAIPEMGTSEMSDAENVQNGGMSRRVSEVNDLLQTMEIVPTAAETTFAQKLADENGWPIARAEAALREYRRFLLMAWVSPDMVVPSKDVDEAWHLHLTHSRHYWEVLCGEILRKPFHHEPSLGGHAEDARHGDAYARTLALYEHLFDEAAPEEVWPRGCTCGAVAGNEGVVLYSSPFIPVFLFGAAAALVAYLSGSEYVALFIVVAAFGVAALASASQAHDERDLQMRAQAAHDRREFESRQRTHYGIGTDPEDLSAKLKKAKDDTRKTSSSKMAKPSPYGRSRGGRGSGRSAAMTGSGDDAGTSFAALLSSDDGSSSSHSHGHSSHSGHSCSSSSSHSCSSSSSHSCSSSSCGGSSCGGGGGD
jgi:hypothetical protein